MEVAPDPHYKRFTGLQSECSVGIVVVGVLVIALGITSAVLLPICYMLYAQQTALGVLYTLTGLFSYVASPRSYNYTAKCAVAMTLHILTWVWTLYIFQVAMNLMTWSFHKDRSIEPMECGYSGDSTDEVMYYVFGGVSLLFAVAHIVFSIFVFVAFWRNPRPSPQMQVRYNMTQPTTYQLQAVPGHSNAGFIQEPGSSHAIVSPTYAADPLSNLPAYTPNPPQATQQLQQPQQLQTSQQPQYTQSQPKDTDVGVMQL